MKASLQLGKFAVLAVSLALLGGCATTVVGAPGEAGIHYTSKGASGQVDASPDQVTAATANVLTRMGIHPIGTAPQDGTQVVTARGNVDQVTVRIEKSGSGSRVEVIDFTGNENWNQDFAGTVLLKIKNSV